ncbi:group II intron reverse transcriptase/maturase [Streptomyces sp. NBC_00893]|uniref:group II intron reverse transcriptase/maturase n=1 Tax=Streptomyces sp. NBC_00893 TaxID=2975862 RepID=UPI002254FC5D|nr:group II intron reverse transcriptase/maturase [Streptomyces sp. NBC_00893]MCX4850930.1 group II intron reverse transcriptase/maturase [Streptomyces sp. NBC_00893]
MNIDDPSDALFWAERRVLGIQTKLHQWATDDTGRRFNDLFNLVCDPAFLLVAWERVRTNRGARTAGVDGISAHAVRLSGREDLFLDRLRRDLKTQTFTPLPVREVMIPKGGSGKLRRLGIPPVGDRVVQAALKLVLEPIFEVDFLPCSYGFRPKRRAQDAIAEIHFFGSRSYEWVLEADIQACFDEIAHPALMDRVRARIGDKRVLALVKAFLKAGIMHTDGTEGASITGTPQGGILSPLLANIALSELDEHFAETWQSYGSDYQRTARRRRGLPMCRLIRYADDWVVMVSGTRQHAEALRAEAAAVLAPMGLRLSEAKTQVVHIDEGFDFLGWHIQRRRKRGTDRNVVYTYPSKKALASIVDKVRAITGRSRHRHLSDLLRQLNSVLRGWCAYFRHGVSAATFGYLDEYSWHRVTRWLRKRHPRVPWASLFRRFLPGKRPTEGGISLFQPQKVPVVRYRYRGRNIPTPWTPIPAAVG